jgi:hypothetical protein
VPEPAWEVGDAVLHDDQAVATAVTQCFEEIYRCQFRDEWLVNHDLPTEVRAFRRMEGWCVFLLLTPWMMSRLFLAERDPGIVIPAEWRSGNRANAPYEVIGPALSFKLLGNTQQAHLNHAPMLGHYLVQPLVQSMERFASADDVFDAWNDVIRTRNRVMEEQKRECGWQKEVSRREFFARLVRRMPAP